MAIDLTLSEPTTMPATPAVPSCWTSFCCEDTSLTPQQVALYIAISQKIVTVNAALEKDIQDMMQQDKYVNAFLLALVAIEPTSEDKALVRAVKTVKRLVATAKNLKNLVDEFRTMITDLECALIAMNTLQTLIKLFEGVAAGTTQQADVDAVSTEIKPNIAERLVGFFITLINFFHTAFAEAKQVSATAAPKVLGVLDNNAVPVQILAGLIAVVQEIGTICKQIHMNCCLCAHYFAIPDAVSEEKQAEYYALLAAQASDLTAMQTAIGNAVTSANAIETLSANDKDTIQKFLANPKASLQTVLNTIAPIISKLQGLFKALAGIIAHH